MYKLDFYVSVSSHCWVVLGRVGGSTEYKRFIYALDTFAKLQNSQAAGMNSEGGRDG